MFSQSFRVISISISHDILINLELINYFPVHMIYIHKKNKCEDSEWNVLDSGAEAINGHNPGNLQNRHLWFDGSEHDKAEIKESVRLIVPEECVPTCSPWSLSLWMPHDILLVCISTCLNVPLLSGF